MTTTAQTDRFIADGLPPADQQPILRFDSAELHFPPQVNLVEELLDKAVQKGFANRPMLRSPRITLTYADVRGRVDRIARVLVEDFGLLPGNRVLLRGGNSIGMALAWLAVVKAGLIAVATMPLLRAKELGEIIDTAQPALALCDFKLIEELQLARAQRQSQNARDLNPSHDPFVIVPFNQMNEPGSMAVLSAQKDADFTACPTAATDIALMAFTSGTTGKPKAAVHTHRDVLAACEAWPRHVLKATPDDIIMGSPPLAFTFGLGGMLIFPMWAGASVYFPDVAYTPEGMAALMNEVGATICYTAPTFYRQMAPFMKECIAQRENSSTDNSPVIDAQPIPRNRLRICVSAGEALPDATRQLWKDATGIEMLDGIGATEMFHIFISSAGTDVRPGAIGKVVPGYTAKVVDDDGAEVPRGTVGKLAVIGPTGCKYFNDARQASYVKAGWNYPGDAFLQDADGYFFYQARTDDMIITAGYNVGAPEVEDALMKHPAVLECAVVGKPDAERGMVVKAFCVLRPGHSDGAGDAAMVKALQDHVKAAIAPFKYPREIEFVSSLPRTETGKLQRFRLKTQS
jgi:2-aminobenzoate-CoA ligase